MRVIPMLATVLTLIGVSGAASSQSPGDSSSADYPHGPDAIPLLNEIWEVAAESIYPSHLAKRFDPLTLETLEGRLRADDSLALADALNPFLGSLGVSHTRFYDRRHQSYYFLRSLFSTRDLDSPQLYTIGVQLDEHSPGLVRAVLEGSPAASAGIQRQDRLLAVDGTPFTSLLQWQRPAATRIHLLREGREHEIVLTPVLQSYHRALASATRASRQVMHCGGRRIGYLHLWAGTHETFLETLKESVTDALEGQLDGFILDLRDGYGGAWWPYLDPFYPDRANYFTYTTTDSNGTSSPVQAEPGVNEKSWMGPLAVIINSGTRSGKESLAYQFRKEDNVTVLGTTTAGAFTAGRGVFADRDVDYIFYLSVQELSLDGTVIEGEGVMPDIVIQGNVGRDAPLAAALAHLALRATFLPAQAAALESSAARKTAGPLTRGANRAILSSCDA
ncbi:S41 family peptidase [Chromatocurvus halotolerans]|uniref:C-terminal processing protease CtpA/Prc n=1 Tax=Chromatocurvus halotolerans TaxID=1132028 RepID=A0A4R2KJE1_9GAMM|nr:S41 family peptidase [Chromatocurvus halotolerans]TCO70696.1 C-terminal processing protease CtpA/Prc [Chromatocurvus halotolerans]